MKKTCRKFEFLLYAAMYSSRSLHSNRTWKPLWIFHIIARHLECKSGQFGPPENYNQLWEAISPLTLLCGVHGEKASRKPQEGIPPWERVRQGRPHARIWSTTITPRRRTCNWQAGKKPIAIIVEFERHWRSSRTAKSRTACASGFSRRWLWDLQFYPWSGINRRLLVIRTHWWKWSTRKMESIRKTSCISECSQANNSFLHYNNHWTKSPILVRQYEIVNDPKHNILS